jgi:hypothetical protein
VQLAQRGGTHPFRMAVKGVTHATRPIRHCPQRPSLAAIYVPNQVRTRSIPLAKRISAGQPQQASADASV